jgi:hypothetical protein
MMVGLSATGCRGGSNSLAPREACEHLSVALCERYFACHTDAEFQAAGPPAACIAKFESPLGCAQQTTTTNVCAGNQKFHGDQASLCVNQVSGLACSQLRDQNLDRKTAVPACAKICS